MVTAWTAIMTTLIGLAIHKTVGMRVKEHEELAGIDITEHAETAYELAMVGGAFHPGEQNGRTPVAENMDAQETIETSELTPSPASK